MTASLQPLSRSTLAAASLVMLLTGAGCGPTDTPGSPPNTATSGATAGPSLSPNQQTSQGVTPGTNLEDQMRIAITIDDQRFHAALDDSQASRDLVAQLPVTVDMRDHGSVEKTGALPSPLSLEGQPAGADPNAGDVGYYAPGNDVVLYYRDQSYYDGIVILGHLDGDAAERIADMEGSINATIESLDE